VKHVTGGHDDATQEESRIATVSVITVRTKCLTFSPFHLSIYIRKAFNK
jgi:hypothetical protein